MPVTAPPDPYREAIERLFGRERGNKGPFGLEGTRALLEDLGHPEREFQAIHVAGTNGKGSTSALIERILRGGGARTGLFTSPHLVDFRERIRIEGCAADATLIARNFERIAASPSSPGRTFFEATFALGMLTFADEKVGIAVLETGLGGRLDSTNVVTPVLSVITPIGLDHTELLGETIEAVAFEKAGIIKPGVPVVVAPQDPRARTVIERRAREVAAPLLPVETLVRVAQVHRIDRTGSEFTLEVHGMGPVRAGLSLLGRHQIANAATAVAAAITYQPGLGHEALAEGLLRARWPGRLEAAPAEPRLFWDGAHNPDGARALRAAWREALGDAPAALVLGLAEDKDAGAILAALAGPWRRVCAVAARSPRARSANEVARLVAQAWPGIPVSVDVNVAAGVERALASLEPGECALVTGSLFVVGEAMTSVGTGDLACL